MSTAAIAVMPTRLAAEVHRPAVHLLPQPLVLQRVLADEQLPQAAGDVVAERRVDDRLDHLGRRVGLADAFQAGVGADADQHRVLAAGGLGLRRSGCAGSGRRLG